MSVTRGGFRISEMEASASFLRNKYWVLRHGKSIPNERGLIVSSMVFFFLFFLKAFIFVFIAI